MKEKTGTMFFWLVIIPLNFLLLIFTLFWQVLSYYGPKPLSREEELDQIMHGLKMLGIALPIGLALVVILNYFAIKSQQKKYWREVFWISFIYIVLNVCVAALLAFDKLNSSS